MDNQLERTELEVAGMTCPSCIRRIDAALRTVVGVVKATVQLQQRRVLVEHRGLDASELIAAIHSAGYEAKVSAGDPSLHNAHPEDAHHDARAAII